MKNNPCLRFSHIGVDGQPVYKPKKVFDTDKEAIAYAKMEKTHKNAMRVVFKDGKMHNRETFTTIRERLANEKD